MCGITTKDQVSWQGILERMQVDDLAKAVRTRWLRWPGAGWLKTVQKLNLIGVHGRGHPKKTWTEAIDMDCLALGLTEANPSGRKNLVQYKLSSDGDDDDDDDMMDAAADDGWWWLYDDIWWWWWMDDGWMDDEWMMIMVYDDGWMMGG